MESMTIKDLFDRRNIYFIVPEYQRAYAWGEKQFSQFIEDLNDRSTIYYYLGHFLFEQYENRFYIIDGQQRMTTCLILFSVIANALRHRQEEWIEQEDADEIQKESLLSIIKGLFLDFVDWIKSLFLNKTD